MLAWVMNLKFRASEAAAAPEADSFLLRWLGR